MLKYEGSSDFRMRLGVATMSGKSLRINNIRTQPSSTMDHDTAIGLQDYEANYLRLLDEISDGCLIEVNETGTKLSYKPGLLVGGRITHDCGTSRAIGWFLEGILPLLLFCKQPTRLQLTGITNDATDMSADSISQVTLPLIQQFGVEGISMTIKRRGAAPKGGGIIELICPVVRSLQPIYLINSGKIRRVRGVVFCARISPTIISRVVDSAKAVLTHIISDVFISADHYKGADGGNSAGYSLFLLAETTTGRCLSVERAARVGDSELPEDIGREGALLLLEEMCLGGAVDRAHQAMVIQLMSIAAEDVSKVRFGQELSSAAISTLRLVQDAYGVTCKLKRSITEEVDDEPDEHHDDGGDDGGDKKKAVKQSRGGVDKVKRGGLKERKVTDEMDSILVSCLGSAYINIARKIK